MLMQNGENPLCSIPECEKKQCNDLCYITAALNHGNRAPAVTDPVSQLTANCMF